MAPTSLRAIAQLSPRPKAMHTLAIPSMSSPHSTLPLAHSTLATQGSLLFIEHTGIFQPQELCTSSSVWKALYPHIHVAPSLRSLLRAHLLKTNFPKLPMSTIPRHSPLLLHVSLHPINSQRCMPTGLWSVLPYPQFCPVINS